MSLRPPRPSVNFPSPGVLLSGSEGLYPDFDQSETQFLPVGGTSGKSRRSTSSKGLGDRGRRDEEKDPLSWAGEGRSPNLTLSTRPRPRPLSQASSFPVGLLDTRPLQSETILFTPWSPSLRYPGYKTQVSPVRSSSPPSPVRRPPPVTHQRRVQIPLTPDTS